MIALVGDTHIIGLRIAEEIGAVFTGHGTLTLGQSGELAKVAHKGLTDVWLVEG